MSRNIKTVDADDSQSYVMNFDPLYQKQRDDVQEMRSSLLQCNSSNDPNSIVKAMKNIAVMRIYHQLARVIRFLEEMDKLEAKMYDTLDQSIDSMEDGDTHEMMMLLNIQTQLINNMATSQKLLEPYIKMMDSAQDYVITVNSAENEAVDDNVIPKASRDKVRAATQSLLQDIQREEASA